MKYLVDTDWVVDFLKGKPFVVEELARLAREGLAISIITYGEIYEGIYFARDPRASEKGFQTFLRGATVLPLNRPIMKHFARLRGEMRKKGQMIGDLDLFIAVTALHYKLVLLTRNRSDFERVPNLNLYPLS